MRRTTGRTTGLYVPCLRCGARSHLRQDAGPVEALEERMEAAGWVASAPFVNALGGVSKDGWICPACALGATPMLPGVA